jgi:hypothetical protein
MKAFNHRVFHLLEQDEPENPELDVKPDDIGDEDAFAASLDKGTNPEDFDTSTPAGVPAVSPEDQIREKQVQQLGQWIEKLTNFTSYLNGVDNNSIQKVLNDAGEGTLFAEIARGERKRIARLAQEMSALTESFKGYMLSSDEE